jgi:hypothetical protein
MSETDHKRCGCCKPAVDAGTPSITNRPALSAIDYRIRDYGSFRRAMIERIPSKKALAGWTARDETDYGIALLDMWAYLGDILTFYQERIANEAFLRTAVHRESVRRLAALLDYHPAPGAAAVAYVAFALEKAKTLQIPVALRLQSVPGQGEKPQKFETVESIAADAALNLLRIHGVPVAFAPFPKGATSIPLASAEIPKSGTAPLASGAPLAIFDHLGMELKTVTAATTDGEVASVAWQPAIARGDFSRITTRLAAPGRRFALFGSDTPEKTMVSEVIGITSPPSTGIQWTERTTDFSLSPPNVIPLDRAMPDLKAGTRVLVVRAAGDDTSAVRLATITSAETKPWMMTSDAGDLTNYTGNVTELTLDLRIISPPVVVPEGTATRPTVFVVAEDGAIWSYPTDRPKWIPLGGTTFTEVAACNAAGTLYLFGGDAAGTLWQSGTSGWTEFGTRLDLVRAGVAANRPYLVARGPDGRVRFRHRDAFAWPEWTTIPNSPQCDRIATLVNAAGAIEIFVRRAFANDIWTTRQTVPGGAWMPWTNLGDSVLDLAAAVNADGSVEVFTIRRNNELGRRRRTGNVWSPWVFMGGWIDLMTVGRDSSNRITIFARENDGKAYRRQQTVANALTWTPWTACAGSPSVESLTAAQSDSALRLYCVCEGALRYFDTFVLWIDYGVPMWPIADRRLVSVLELTSDPLPIAAKKYPASITASPITVPLSKLASLEVNRTIILDDASRNPHIATVTATAAIGAQLQVTFTPDLTRSLDDASATLYGNVAKVTHGETQASQVLGSGDAASRFQTFTVAKPRVTHVLQAGAPNGVASTLEVRVDSVRWNEVDTLLDHGSDERVYVTSIDEKDVMTVRFGGDPGARLTTGRSNVTAKYRVGLGIEGNVAAGVLTNLLDRPTGLKGATNPERADGGAAAESIDGIRENAPNTVRTFGRIVSLRDFEDAAREHAGVAKARATWTMQKNERVVRLTVAADGGSPLTSTALALIVEDLDARRDSNRPMHARSHENVPFSVIATVQVQDDYLLEDVQTRADAALASFFSFDKRDLGEPVHLSAVYAALQSLDGVVAVNITRLRRKSGGPEVGDHILIQAFEIASLASPADAVVKTQFETL